MAATPILLVADDLALIASVKRVLVRHGYEVLLATSAADAVISWGHSLPGLILLQPSVESGRGHLLLEELQRHPDAQLVRTILLGEAIAGFPLPIEPTPIDAEHLTRTVDEAFRGAQPAVETPAAPEAAVGLEALEQRLFGDLVADLEIAPPASVEPVVIPADPRPEESDVLARAEQMIRISHAEHEARRREEEAELLQLKNAMEEALHRAHLAEENLKREAAKSAQAEHQRLTLQEEIQQLKSMHAQEKELARLRHEGELDAVRIQLETRSEAMTAQSTEQRASLEAQLQAEGLQRSRLEAELQSKMKRADELEGEVHRLTQLVQTTASEKQRREELELALSAKERELQSLAQALHTAQSHAALSVDAPGKPSISIARRGDLNLQSLAHLVMQLVDAPLDLCLELRVDEGTRHLWFHKGHIAAAESSVEHEHLIQRARRDGLIDGRQERELQMLRGATPRGQLDALKARGFIRDIETVPLVQRHTEHVALQALSEPSSTYRILDEAPPPHVLMATVPRPTLPMLAESLRRAVSPEDALHQLGGGAAVPTLIESELDLRALGFSERERKMLTWADSESTIEDLSLASGLKPDVAFRTLRVAQLLGVLDVKPGPASTEPPSGELELQRLESKFDEVQDADYFTILGLPRGASTDDVRRASERLSQLFDPLRFSGHPDPAVHQRALAVCALIEEATRALEDDRRRAEYARHLLT